jgi:hypothetical protein
MGPGGRRSQAGDERLGNVVSEAGFTPFRRSMAGVERDCRSRRGLSSSPAARIDPV